MARFVPLSAILRNVMPLIVGGCLIALGWTPSAVAQVRGGHVGGGHVGGGVRTGVPAPARAVPPRPMFTGPRVVGVRGAGPRLAGVGPTGFRFGPRPFATFRRRVFFRPFFWYGVGWGFYSNWWSPCGVNAGWVWSSGFNCPMPSYATGSENYVTLQPYEPPVYFYGGDDREMVWLYLKNGSVYRVKDYWFVNDQVHFSVMEQDPLKPTEHVIPYDSLNVQKTAYVNAQRGFRMVRRDEPWQQYFKDHPDATPPDLAPPDKE